MAVRSRCRGLHLRMESVRETTIWLDTEAKQVTPDQESPVAHQLREQPFHSVANERPKWKCWAWLGRDGLHIT